jgi:hypothetical protein
MGLGALGGLTAFGQAGAAQTGSGSDDGDEASTEPAS